MVGSHLGVIETTYQPMKVAAMEGQWETCAPCSFSAFQIGGWTTTTRTPTKIIEIPHLLSILATGTWDGQVVGLNELQAQYEKQYGPGDYIPNLFIQYWSMRVMAYLGSVLPILALWGALVVAPQEAGDRRGSSSGSRPGPSLAPFVMNTAGWLLTENGRQPWVVQGLLLTEDGNSPSVSLTEVAISLGVLLGPLHRARHRVGLPDDPLRPTRRSSSSPTARRTPTDPGSDASRPGPHVLRGDVMSLDVVWFVVVAVFWTGLLRPRGLRLRRRHAAQGRRAHRRRAPRRDQRHRAGLGRQRGLADRRRRRDLRRVPELVRHLVLGRLPRADAASSSR